jgi:hypothetical protein
VLYEDHIRLVKRAQYLQSRNEKLVDPANREDQIKQLQGEIAALKKHPPYPQRATLPSYPTKTVRTRAEVKDFGLSVIVELQDLLNEGSDSSLKLESEPDLGLTFGISRMRRLCFVDLCQVLSV